MRIDAYTLCGVAFYPLDHLVFASDCPFDSEKGLRYNLENPIGRDLAKSKVFA